MESAKHPRIGRDDPDDPAHQPGADPHLAYIAAEVTRDPRLGAAPKVLYMALRRLEDRNREVVATNLEIAKTCGKQSDAFTIRNLPALVDVGLITVRYDGVNRRNRVIRIYALPAPAERPR